MNDLSNEQSVIFLNLDDIVATNDVKASDDVQARDDYRAKVYDFILKKRLRYTELLGELSSYSPEKKEEPQSLKLFREFYELYVQLKISCTEELSIYLTDEFEQIYFIDHTALPFLESNAKIFHKAMFLYIPIMTPSSDAFPIQVISHIDPENKDYKKYLAQFYRESYVFLQQLSRILKNEHSQAHKGEMFKFNLNRFVNFIMSVALYVNPSWFSFGDLILQGLRIAIQYENDAAKKFYEQFTSFQPNNFVVIYHQAFIKKSEKEIKSALNLDPNKFCQILVSDFTLTPEDRKKWIDYLSNHYFDKLCPENQKILTPLCEETNNPKIEKSIYQIFKGKFFSDSSDDEEAIEMIELSSEKKCDSEQKDEHENHTDIKNSNLNPHHSFRG